MKVASAEGLQGAAIALAASSTVVLGACKLFPRFNKSLSVSGKTALIVSWLSAAAPAACCRLCASQGFALAAAAAPSRRFQRLLFQRFSGPSMPHPA